MLQVIVDWVLYSIFGLSAESRLVQSLNFFLYDSVKILLLLFVMIAVIGFLRSYIPPEKIRRVLSKQKYGTGNATASLFGAITPFCSCSSIPIFLSFLRAGVPLGITFSFLITSPLVNEYLVVLMLGFFGWKITLAYVVFGMVIGVISGILLGKMNLNKYIVEDISGNGLKQESFNTFKDRIKYGFNEAKGITRKLWYWILIGVGVGAIIHNYIPQEVIQSIIGKAGVFAVPLAVILGVPLYGSCAAIVPIALVLFQKGVSLGTALAFMMAISALSFPEAVILRRAMKLKLILIFFGIVTLAIILSGYAFNAIQHILA